MTCEYADPPTGNWLAINCEMHLQRHVGNFVSLLLLLHLLLIGWHSSRQGEIERLAVGVGTQLTKAKENEVQSWAAKERRRTSLHLPCCYYWQLDTENETPPRKKLNWEFFDGFPGRWAKPSTHMVLRSSSQSALKLVQNGVEWLGNQGNCSSTSFAAQHLLLLLLHGK